MDNSKEGYESYEIGAEDSSKLESIFKNIKQHLKVGVQLELHLKKKQSTETKNIDQDPILSKYELIHTSQNSQKHAGLLQTPVHSKNLSISLLINQQANISCEDDRGLLTTIGPTIKTQQLLCKSPDIEIEIESSEGDIASGQLKKNTYFRRQTLFFDKEAKTFEEKFESHSLTQKLESAKDNIFNNKIQIGIAQLKALNEKIDVLVRDKTIGKMEHKLFILIGIQCYVYLAEGYKRLSQPKRSISYLNELLRVYSIHEPNTVSKIYLEIAGLFLQDFKPNRALDIYLQLLRYFEHLNWNIEVAFCLSQIGYIMALYGFPGESKLLCYTAKEMCESKLEHNDVRLAECYHNLGMVCFINKELEFALQHLEHSAEIKKQLPEDMHLFLVKTLNQLGIVNHMLGLLCQSVARYKEALNLIQEEINVQKSQILNNLGLAYADLQNSDEALKCFNRALHILRSFHGSSYMDVQSRRIKYNINQMKHGMEK